MQGAELHQNESNAGRLLGCRHALETGKGSSFICNHYLSWPSGNRVREKRARSSLSLHFFLSADANTQVSRLLLCLPMLHHSKYLQETQCFFLTHLLLRPRFSLHPLLLCSLCFSICMVCRKDKGVSLLTLPAGVKPDRFDLQPSLLCCCHCNKPTLLS